MVDGRRQEAVKRGHGRSIGLRDVSCQAQVAHRRRLTLVSSRVLEPEPTYPVKSDPTQPAGPIVAATVPPAAGVRVLAAATSDNVRILSLGAIILALDQLTKWIVERTLPYGSERIVIDGFFNLVHWGNTGSAWSMFRGNNLALAAVSAIALVLLWVFRSRFDSGRITGQMALGLLFGGISGNLLDRLVPSRQHVVDFLYFHLHSRGGHEMGFPAFNVADSAICTGVGFLILLSLLERPNTAAAPFGS